MKEQKIRLQTRDTSLTTFLMRQGFATFEQLQAMFFPSKMSCSKRLRALEATGYITSISASAFFRGNNQFTPFLLGLNLHPLTRIYQLSSTYRRQVPETNRLLKKHLCLHQLILNDVRVKLTSELRSFSLVLNDPQLKTWSIVDPGRRKEFTPDLSYEMDRFSLAIEVERTLKSDCRYTQRFGFYLGSSYTHVLYVYVNDAHLPTLLAHAGASRLFAFSHYLHPTEVFCRAWGYLKLNDWIDKVKSVTA